MNYFQPELNAAHAAWKAAGAPLRSGSYLANLSESDREMLRYYWSTADYSGSMLDYAEDVRSGKVIV